MFRPCGIRPNGPCKLHNRLPVFLERKPLLPEPHINVPALPEHRQPAPRFRIIQIRHPLPLQHSAMESPFSDSLIHRSTPPVHHLVLLLHTGRHSQPFHINRLRNLPRHLLHRPEANTQNRLLLCPMEKHGPLFGRRIARKPLPPAQRNLDKLKEQIVLHINQKIGITPQEPALQQGRSLPFFSLFLGFQQNLKNYFSDFSK